MEVTLRGLKGRYAGKTAILKLTHLKIGRDAGNNLAIGEDLLLSRFHAVLYQEGDSWYVVDLWSTNGTFLDGQPVGQSGTKVPSGSVISCGEQVFILNYSAHRLSPIPPPVVAPPRVAPAKEPPPAPSKTPEARWYGRGDRIVVQGIELNDPLAYIGSRLLGKVSQKGDGPKYGFAPWDEEPSLIVPTYKARYQAAPPEPPIYGTYHDLMSAQREVYLSWIAKGRRGQIEPGYVRLFIAGLEMRLFGEGNQKLTQEQRSEALEEAAALLEEYKSEGTCAGVLAKLLLASVPTSPTPPTRDLMRETKYWSPSDDDWRFLLDNFAAEKRPLTEDFATAWIQTSRRRLAREMVPIRCPVEFHSLFLIRFRQKFPQGIPTKKGSGRGVMTYPGINRRLTAVQVQAKSRCSNVPEILGDLTKISEGCLIDLQEFARRLGAHKNQLDRRAALHLLPKDLKGDSAEYRALAESLTLLSLQPGGVSTASVQATVGILGSPTKSIHKQVLEILDEFSVLMEPDVRYGGRTSGPDDKVFLVQLPHGATTTPSDGYLEAVSMAPFVACLLQSQGAPSDITPSEFGQLIAGDLNLSESDQLRLGHYVAQTLQKPVRVTKTVAEKVPKHLRANLGEALLQLAEGMGTLNRSQIKVLVTLLEQLGLETKEIYSRLHTGASTPPRPIQAPAVAGAPQVHKKPAEIDMALLATRLKETDDVSRLLTEVFAEEEDAGQIVFEPSAAAAMGIEALLGELQGGVISMAGFSELAKLHGLAPNQAFTELNEWALDRAGDNLLYGDDPIEIDEEILGLLRQ